MTPPAAWQPMETNLKILQSRVEDTVRRIKELCSERDGLVQEVASLNQQVTDLTKQNASLSGGLSEEERQHRIDAVATILREAIEELREESSDRSGVTA